MSEAALSAPVNETDTAKRQQIPDGARRCFLAQGFDGASMKDIVNEAGVSRGTVYAYFPSKGKLFAAMVFEDKRRHAERAVVLGDETRPVAEVLHPSTPAIGRTAVRRGSARSPSTVHERSSPSAWSTRR